MELWFVDDAGLFLLRLVLSSRWPGVVDYDVGGIVVAG